jgi:CheY-like chemotaxis protein/anti-sigma regulatory factor (Ser/Thr protein kinase)
MYSRAMAAKTVLVVDDDPEVHELLRSMLKDSNWETESVFGGEQALALLEAEPFDVVLTDILMPEMDGLTLLNRIHAIRPGARVLVMTAFNRPDRVAGSLRGQAAGYITKPFTKDRLIDSLSDALTCRMEPDDIEVISDRPNWISLNTRCKLETADRLTQFFHELPTDLSVEQRDMTATAFRELLVNAIEHGGHLDPEKKVELHFIRTARSLVYYLRDPGQGFSIDKLPHAAISNPDSPMAHAEVREQMGIRPGGFGLLLLKNFADELIYSAKGNEVILIKHLL